MASVGTLVSLVKDLFAELGFAAKSSWERLSVMVPSPKDEMLAVPLHVPEAQREEMATGAPPPEEERVPVTMRPLSEQLPVAVKLDALELLI